jgi:uncharacterized membrane protein YfcA
MVGFVTGVVGVGGGFLIVPTLAIALGFTCEPRSARHS